MSALAPTLEAFFTSRLINEKGVSPHTIAAYRDTFRLLLCFAQQRTGKQPSKLEIEDLDAPLITAFLDHLEHDRHNSPRTRNARLAAIHSMFRFAALRHPEHAALIARVIAVPTKRFDRAIVSYPHQRRGRRAARRARPLPLDRPSRPRAADHRDPDRPARLRTHRPALPGRAPRHRRRTSRLPREGPEAARHAAHQPDRRRAPRYGCKSATATPTAAVPDQPRQSAQPRRDRAADRQARHHRHAAAARR